MKKSEAIKLIEDIQKKKGFYSGFTGEAYIDGESFLEILHELLPELEDQNG